jgi:hypothetical protein
MSRRPIGTLQAQTEHYALYRQYGNRKYRIQSKADPADYVTLEPYEFDLAMAMMLAWEERQEKAR